ncbi:MAG: serine/threonine protein phosphatase [Bacteroidales bacterium]|nr:serine/threonine protein phosphatase [Bacteroidales bacterium]
MKNYWIIGDIHGEIRLLDRLLEQILTYDPAEIVFLGDYIDRGPHSKEVVDRIMGLKVPTVCLMGNHEWMMLNAMEDSGFGYNPMELWYLNGGEATLHSFGFSGFFSFQSQMEDRYMDFFRNLRLSCTIQLQNKVKILATHAGISPTIPVADHSGLKNYRELQQYMVEKHLGQDDSFLWVRDAFFSSSPDLWNGCVVVHGHTPVLKLKRFIHTNGQEHFHFVENDLCMRRGGRQGRIVSVDIDSGSTISGRLTGLGFFEKDSPASRITMKGITATYEEIFPRNLGPLSSNH